MNKKLLLVLVLLLVVSFGPTAFASLTFTSNAITGTTASSLDLGAGNTLSLNTTNNAPITTGTGLTTLGGSLKVAGLTAGRIPLLSTEGLLTTNAGVLSDFSTGAITLTSQGVSVVPLTINAIDGQTANYMEWKDSTGFKVMAVDYAGLRSDFVASLNYLNAYETPFIGLNDAGISFHAGNTTPSASNNDLYIGAGRVSVKSLGYLGWASSGTNGSASTVDTLMRRKNTANPAWGLASATPVAYTHTLASDGTGTNIAGANATIQSGTGTGNATGSALIITTPTVTSSGAGVQTQTERARFDSNGLMATAFRLSALNTAPATAAEACTTGEIRIATGYIYVCVATNSWQRSAMASW